jgi:hypothetical protein
MQAFLFVRSSLETGRMSWNEAVLLFGNRGKNVEIKNQLQTSDKIILCLESFLF